MSLTTILGIILGFGLFVGSVVLKTANYMLFLDFASFIMVIGGTLAATFIAFESVITSYSIHYTKLYESAYDDVFTNLTGIITEGGAGNDSYTAGSGNDTFYGGTGDDAVTIQGTGSSSTPDVDVFSGGTGTDTLSLSSDLSAYYTEIDAGAGTLTLKDSCDFV